MIDVPAKAVIDASVVIAALNEDEEGHAQSVELLEDAESGIIELWAPAVILVEVLRWTRDADPRDPSAREQLEEFLEGDWLNVVEVDRHMARVARDVVFGTAVNKGVDALYVAAAVILEIPVVYAWDSRIVETEYEDVHGMEPPGSQQPKLRLPSGPRPSQDEDDEDDEDLEGDLADID